MELKVLFDFNLSSLIRTTLYPFRMLPYLELLFYFMLCYVMLCWCPRKFSALLPPTLPAGWQMTSKGSASEPFVSVCVSAPLQLPLLLLFLLFPSSWFLLVFRTLALVLPFVCLLVCLFVYLFVRSYLCVGFIRARQMDEKMEAATTTLVVVRLLLIGKWPNWAQATLKQRSNLAS